MRKIQKKEIRTAAETMADCFMEYPLYQSFFPDKTKRRRQLYYFCWYSIFVRRNFTYLSDDGASVLSVQKPGDRFTSAVWLVLNPVFLLGILFTVPLSSLMMLPGYARLSSRETHRFFHPETDWFVHFLCTRKQTRGFRRFLSILQEMDEGEPLYCFTHTIRNVRLYQLIGFEVLHETRWNQAVVYTMRRERKCCPCGHSM